MDEEQMNYRILRKIQNSEKNSSLLSPLKNDFYSLVNEYIENLNNRHDNETSSQKKLLLNEEIKNTNKIIVNIYELREKKIILSAITKVRGGNPDIKNMLNIEKHLYDSLLKILSDSRNNFLQKKEESIIDNNDNNSNDEKENDSKKLEKTIDKNNKKLNPIVMVKKDIPEFVGTDFRKYSIKKGDILSIPDNMCEMLQKRGIVRKIYIE